MTQVSDRNLHEEWLNDTPEEEAAFWAKVKDALAKQAYTEVLSYAEFVPEEHPRDAEGKFAKGDSGAAIGDQVSYKQGSVQGEGKVVDLANGLVHVKSDIHGMIALLPGSVSVKEATGASHALGTTRIPSAEELVDATHSPFSSWLVSGTEDAQRSASGKPGFAEPIPSEVSETDRQSYKAAIAEHLGNALVEAAKASEGLRGELERQSNFLRYNPTPISEGQKAWINARDKENALEDYRRGLLTLEEVHAHEGLSETDLETHGITTRADLKRQLQDEDKKAMEAVRQAAPDIASNFIHTWAETSADTHPDALAIQETVSKEFGIPLAPHIQKPLDEMRGQVDYVMNVQGETIKTLLRAQYDWTQSELKKAGITEVTLYRGMQGLPKTTTTGLDDRVTLQPLSSFSVEYQTAMSFANEDKEGNAITVMRVPASRVFSTAKTGFGCLNEGEVVVLGGQGLPGMTTWAHEAQGIGGMIHSLPALTLQRTFLSALEKQPEVLGTLTGRTQQHVEHGQRGTDLDAELNNADWTKETWDLPFTTVVDLRAYLERQGIGVGAFKALPTYKRNVQREGFEWLRSL